MKENRQLNHFVIGKERIATNHFVVGQIGIATKSIVFKENEFKKELAPINSKITCFEIAGEKYIEMAYRV